MAYLDHAATTPLRPEAAEVLTRLLGVTGNPSSVHADGRAARRHVEEAREQVAAAVGARPAEVVFTGSGTEADNLAVKGIFWSRRAEDARRTRVLVSPLEHSAVSASAHWLAQAQGATVETVRVDPHGRLDLDHLAELVAADPGSVALVSVMAASNEIGTVQPLAEVVAVAAPHGIPVHSDAVQALPAVPLDVAALGLDALAVSAHKVGGPLGVGALVLRGATAVTPVLHGGGQERDVRSGSVPHVLTAAFGAAVSASQAARQEEVRRLRELRDRLVAGVQGLDPSARLNGDPAHGLPGLASVVFPGCDAQAALQLLDAEGVSCSAGSACHAGVSGPSDVLLATGLEPEDAAATLRFSLGHTSTAADVAALLEVLPTVLDRARRAALLGV
ncbi:cysteine desulfurase family protein [Motilibacter rhizosphaerae]|nr:cysteine desulfurase family protein [Motilibacter rhizosphaerae]